MKTEPITVNGLGRHLLIPESISELSEQEFSDYSHAQTKISDYQSNLDLFDLIERNYNKYQLLLGIVLDSLAINGARILVEGRISLEFNGNLTDFLSSAVIYLNYTENSIKRQYGEDSTQFQQFKACTAREFDSYFPYRLLYHLRHYTQHYGFPINHFNYAVQANKMDSRHPLTKFEVGIIIKKLQHSGFNWHSRLIADFATADDILDINSYVRIYMECLRRIRTDFVEGQLDSLKSAANIIQSILNKIGDKQGTPCIMDVNTDISETVMPDVLNLTYVTIPVQWVQFILSGKLNPADEESLRPTKGMVTMPDPGSPSHCTHCNSTNLRLVRYLPLPDATTPINTAITRIDTPNHHLAINTWQCTDCGNIMFFAPVGPPPQQTGS